MTTFINPIDAAEVIGKHADILIVGGIELKQALEYAAALCRREPAVQDLLMEVDGDVGVCSCSVLDAADRVKGATP